MAINKLTDTVIRNAKPESKEYTKGDGGGLALKISPNGSKTWIFNYTRPLTKKRTSRPRELSIRWSRTGTKNC
jgi:hypothetical protein